MKSLKHLAGLGLLASFALPGAALADAKPAVTPEAVIAHYADVGQAKFADALTTGKALDAAVDAFLADPSEANLQAAKKAWLAARVVYPQTEVYRFGNPIVDDWEGRVNSWPLDEGLIDYVDASYGTESDENPLYTANVIANPIIKINGKEVDASKITPKLLSQTLQGAGGVDANVATGYHAIEFLLWGQDLNGNGPGAGKRPATDYSLKNCTHGHCDRRRAYLKAASDLLVSDLAEMANDWKPGGAARVALQKRGMKGGLSTILTGMGSLSYGELAGERMKLGLLLGDPEEEQDCFSDNTYNSHLYDAMGIRGAYTGTYTRPDGTKMSGPSLSQLLAQKAPAVAKELSTDLDTTMAAMQVMAKRGRTVEAYDQMIAKGNTKGNAVVQAAIDGLITQTHAIERAMTALNLEQVKLEGSNSLDNPAAIFK